MPSWPDCKGLGEGSLNICIENIQTKTEKRKNPPMSDSICEYWWRVWSLIYMARALCSAPNSCWVWNLYWGRRGVMGSDWKAVQKSKIGSGWQKYIQRVLDREKADDTIHPEYLLRTMASIMPSFWSFTCLWVELPFTLFQEEMMKISFLFIEYTY